MTITVDLVFALLVAAVVLFVLACGVITRLTKGWLVPAGLACTALAFLIQWKFK